MTWTVNARQMTAVGAEVPVIAGGEVLATLTPMWSDEDGVRTSLAGYGALDDLSAAQMRTLADALCQVADMPGPQ
ncbi:hypothetical protein ACLM5J_03620 [Nocardioides sp. Bht2]|uniref:hypothetical protein n=1 Tax=Nocardioides sp. Bht2 TaxID=3392297 RepID=UPI0039B67D03